MTPPLGVVTSRSNAAPPRWPATPPPPSPPSDATRPPIGARRGWVVKPHICSGRKPMRTEPPRPPGIRRLAVPFQHYPASTPRLSRLRISLTAVYSPAFPCAGLVVDDPGCSCGNKVGVLVNGGQRILACNCFSIPAEAFQCDRDADCVVFQDSCAGDTSVPDISVHRDWQACLAAYRSLYCGRYNTWERGFGVCWVDCSRPSALCPRTSCVAGRCRATVQPSCSDRDGSRWPEYPVTSPTVPGANCGRE